MKTFTDKNGDEWSIELNASTAFEIDSYDFAEAAKEKSPYYIDFLAPQDTTFQTIVRDLRICFTMVWVCCRKQAMSRDINSMSDFAELFDGPALDNARVAFWEELPNFFQDRKTTLETLIQRYLSLRKKVEEKVNRRGEELVSEEKIDKILDAQLDQMEKKVSAALEGLEKDIAGSISGDSPLS